MKAQDLKNSILQLAVQGKLVEQNPADEPVAVLLEMIRQEKRPFFDDKSIKSEKIASDIFKGADNLYYEIFDGEKRNIDDELPFAIPDNWVWARLGSINYVARGGSPRPIKQYITNEPNGINWIKIGDTEQGGKYIFSTEEKIKPEGMRHSRFVNEGDFLLSNSMSFGRPYILKTSGCIHDGWLVIKLDERLLYPDFFYYLLSSRFMYNQFADLAAGSTVKNLKSDTVKMVYCPIPPLAEQQRIVEKIESLLPVVQEYGEAEQELTALNGRFPEDLKKSILQAAVQGKLVEQNPADEPAAVLIERIKAEKDRLIKEKKIKANKVSSFIFKGEDSSYYENVDGEIKCIDDEIPFEIPDSWEWVRLGDIGTTNIGLTYKPTDISSDGIPVLRSNNIQNGKIVYSDLVKVKADISEKLMVCKDDILICARNGSRALVGKSALIEAENMAFGAFMAIYRSQCNHYIHKFMNSRLFRVQLEGATTTTINQITQNMLKQIICPLPPLMEQQLIVKMTNELIAMCDKLSQLKH